VLSSREQSDGAVFPMKTGTLRILVCTPSMMRLVYAPGDSFPARPDYVIRKTGWPRTDWTVRSTASQATLKTADGETRQDPDLLR
jgi:hypothetical protein